MSRRKKVSHRIYFDDSQEEQGMMRRSFMPVIGVGLLGIVVGIALSFGVGFLLGKGISFLCGDAVVNVINTIFHTTFTTKVIPLATGVIGIVICLVKSVTSIKIKREKTEDGENISASGSIVSLSWGDKFDDDN